MASDTSLFYNKILKTPGPLERLFSGSSSACILDFMMLAAQKDHYYSESEIAHYSGVSLKNTKATISNLQDMGLIREEVLTLIAGKRKKNSKRYTFISSADSALSKVLASLVLELTNSEVAKTSNKYAAKSIDPNYVGGDVVDELIDAGLVKLSGSKPDNDK
jgi:hypothetical protein